MDNGYATLRCSLRVHPRCDACKRHTMEILTSIVGTYDISLDAERSLAMIVGQVDPNYCMKALARCDGHAQVVWANLTHPKMRGGGGGGSYDYGTLGEQRWWPYNINYDHPSYDYGSLGERRWWSDNINYDHPYYPRIDYTIPAPYQNQHDSINLCTIL